MKQTEQIDKLCAALSKMQASLEAAPKSSKGYNYKYSDLATVWSVLQKPLTDNGLTVFQEAFTIDGDAAMRTKVMHSSGQWIETEPLILPMGKKDAHSTGSAITYMKRYQLSAALGLVCDDDDDGAKAMEAGPAKQKAKKVNIANWVQLQADTLRVEVDLINEFLEKHCSHYKIEVQDAVNTYAMNTKQFEAHFGKWIDKRQNVQ